MKLREFVCGSVTQLPLLTRLGIPHIWGADVQSGWRLMQYTVFPVTRLLARGSRVYGHEHVPESGSAVLASNHFAAIDGFLIGSFFTRAVWFMVKMEAMQWPFAGEALGWTGGFPVRRGTCSHHTFRDAMDLVDQGHLVGVFAEGTRQPDPSVAAEIQRGAVFIAMQKNVPMIPCAIDSFGWSALTHRRSCSVVFGPAMSFEDLACSREGYREAAARLREELARLLDLAQEATTRRFPEELSDGSVRGIQPTIKEIRRVPNSARRLSGYTRYAQALAERK